MNVAMNIVDKAGFYREIHRVLRPGAWLVLSEVAQGPNGIVDFPTPWAGTVDASFLATPAETRECLQACGFSVEQFRETADAVLAFGARSRAVVDQGEKPPHRAVQLIHAERSGVAIANTSRGIAQGRIVPIEVFCRTNIP